MRLSAINRQQFVLKRCCLFLALSGLQACTVLGPDYVRPASQIAADWQGDSLQNAPKSGDVSNWTRQGQWWRHFNDPVLDALIAEVLRKNHTLKAAALRLLEARAQQGIAGSAMFPQVQQLNGSVLNTERRQSGHSANQWLYSADLSVGWELDFWGRFARGIEAADANYLASLAKYDEVAILLAAQTAEFYSMIRTLEARLKIVENNAKIQKRSLEITERLFKSGNESELDVQQARTQYLGTVSSIPPLQASLRQTQNALATLLARAPGALPEMQTGTGIVPQASLNMIADLPADMLRRRPDVRAAEMLLKAQSALIGVAEADLYPSLTLLGSLGISTTSISGSPSTVDLGIGPAIKWNIFDYGRIKNNVRVQDARFQQLAELYQDAVLQAAREVDNAAVSYAKSLEQIDLLEQGQVAAQRSLDIANIQYREGMAGFERVLDAQRALLSQQERVVSNRGNVVSSLISVYKAMGGTWEIARPSQLLDDETVATMKARSNWGDLLDSPAAAASSK
ncbi:efflux transporter outer membrane subunit [Chitinibacter sp. S2-10]|uniref:efflux transporter outer membrane subunit n=1 Tax=Chitinibacter sp. S2-10 TaxID=3373597 RepID=UPI003977C4AE